MRVARWRFAPRGPSVKDSSLEILVDLARLDETLDGVTYHLVATLRTTGPVDELDNIVNQLQEEDAFMLHPVESRIFAWLRQSKPSPTLPTLPTLPHFNLEELTLFTECPFENFNFPTNSFYSPEDY